MYDRHESTCILVYGKKGKGKSYLSLRLCELLDENFKLAYVCFGAEEFIRLLNTNLPVGSCIIYDEIGVGSNSRRSQSQMNLNMSFITQLIRPSCITVFFTTIAWPLVDAQVRNLMDYSIKAEGFDRATQISTFKFYAIEPKQDSPEPYRKNLVFHINGQPIKHMSWTCKIPSKELRLKYEKMRKEYMVEQFKNSNPMIVSDVVGKASTKLSDIADYVVSNKETFKVGDVYSSILIKEKFNLGMNAANSITQLSRALEKKITNRIKPSL
jgi:hypothetical protein